MKVILQDTSKFVLRFDKGEDVIKGLIAFCDKQTITAGHFTGLGACASVTLAYYDLITKKYLDKTFPNDMEIVSLSGNVGTLKKETVIHAHGVFSDLDYNPYGGHVKELIVSATCEIHLTVLKGIMERGFDKETGLNLLT
jgi:predicted DNA-binding protein with PD1-like motif